MPIWMTTHSNHLKGWSSFSLGFMGWSRVVGFVSFAGSKVEILEGVGFAIGDGVD
jgi:hypothetical protein